MLGVWTPGWGRRLLSLLFDRKPGDETLSPDDEGNIASNASQLGLLSASNHLAFRLPIVIPEDVADDAPDVPVDRTLVDIPKSAQSRAAVGDDKELYPKGCEALAKYREIGGRFLWFRRSLTEFPAGLDSTGGGHPFLVVDCQICCGTGKALLGVCMVRSFSSASPERARRIADADKYLIPIWPNAKSASANPPIVHIECNKTTPRLSWINANKIFYIKEECFWTEKSGKWGELRLQRGGVRLIRDVLRDNANSGIKQPPSMPLVREGVNLDNNMQKATSKAEDVPSAEVTALPTHQKKSHSPENAALTPTEPTSGPDIPESMQSSTRSAAVLISPSRTLVDATLKVPAVTANDVSTPSGDKLESTANGLAGVERRLISFSNRLGFMQATNVTTDVELGHAEPVTFREMLEFHWQDSSLQRMWEQLWTWIDAAS